MTYNVSNDVGMAERKHFIHIPSADFAAISQGSDQENLDLRNYAQLVYTVNASASGGGGGASIVGLNGTGDVALSGDQLKVYDGESIALLTQISNGITITDTVQVSAVGINGNGDVALSGDQLKVYDGEAITELQSVNTALDTINSGIKFGDSPSIDAFGRLRVSDQLTIFDSKLLYDKQPLFWDEELSGTGTSTHSVSGANVTMGVSANNDYVIRQSRQRMNYQPGKSQLVLMTGVMGGPTANITKKIGYFSTSVSGDFTENIDGIWFECDGGNMYVRAAQSGVDTVNVAQASWNIDPMDGSGPSAHTIDWTKSQIFVMDFEWLGVGRVRYGLVKDGLVYYVHQNTQVNNHTNVYMSSPNQPLRYEIRSTGGTDELVHICGSVASEGGQTQNGFLRSVNTASAITVGSGATEGLIGIRLKSDRLGAFVTPLRVEVLNQSNADARWILTLDPTLGGTALSWTSLTNSSIEYADATDSGDNITVSDNGTIIDQGFIENNNSGTITVALETFLHLGSAIDGTPTELWLIVEDFGAGGDAYRGSITFRDQV